MTTVYIKGVSATGETSERKAQYAAHVQAGVYRSDLPDTSADRVLRQFRDDYIRSGWKVDYDTAKRTVKATPTNPLQHGCELFCESVSIQEFMAQWRARKAAK